MDFKEFKGLLEEYDDEDMNAFVEATLNLMDALDPETLNEEQIAAFGAVLETAEDLDVDVDDLEDDLEGAEDDLDEGAAAKRVRIDPQKRRERKKKYRKNKAKIKQRMRKYRKTSKFKKYKKKAKRMGKTGKTATGKRKRKIIN